MDTERATRSLTVLKDGDREIAVLLRTYDGFPVGHGRDLFDALGGKVVVDGYTDAAQINDAGDMAVQLVAFLKARLSARAKTPLASPGNLYLLPAGARGCEQEFTYTLTCRRDGIDVEVCGGAEFAGSLAEFGAWLDRQSARAPEEAAP
ncbi:MAG: hypothetical protein KC636_39480 [Myxococcales bacterium]|nr:hypothetical protein [Myxococcales bacterium]